ncbi:dTDP-4-dehydrorhamnose reductase [Actinokineospora pegani]|uniref:dTDP-4-dehydrorhamnose reductase n=1 Tax=Actinokineospora pegani TaxID=2654637 RepID=UPI0012EA8F1D|nr:dTDP-4-dehydrorhamnose reductase [Actinokineospora pegani]
MALALLVPGGSGQLGRELAALAGPDLLVRAEDSAALDLTQTRAVIAAVSAFAKAAAARGDTAAVVNAAAYTAVDKAESDRARAYAVNVDGPRVLAAACSSRGLPLIHVSTDYVFPGDADRPYEVDDETGPKSVYGATKLAGEQAVLRSGARSWIVRTAWVYGAHGANFVKTMARLESTRDRLSVVDDQRGAPTWTRDLAAGLVELAARATAGRGPAARVLHATGAGETTWCGFARAVFEELGADPARVSPCTTADYPTPAARPAYSVLSGRAWAEAGLPPLRPWREALSAAFAEDAAAYRPA